jgi:Leucine-rich repeat (LRR) protein
MQLFAMLVLVLSTVLASIQSDCEQVVRFARQLNMKNEWFARVNLNAPNCCSPVGPIRCQPQGLTEINFASLELNGTLSALDLPFLENLTLSTNHISGALPSWNLPLLVRLDVSRNYLQGAVPSMQLPRLEYLNLEANNGLLGTLPDLNAPLKECRLPTSLCYDEKKLVPAACRVMIKCPETIVGSPPPTAEPSSLSLGAKLSIGFSAAAFVILCFLGLFLRYKKPETTSSVLKILRIAKKPKDSSPDADIRLIRTTDHYDLTYDIISSYK